MSDPVGTVAGVAVNARDLPAQRFGPLELRELPFSAEAFGVSLLHERLPARSKTPLLHHAATEEAVYVLKGRGFILLDGRKIPVRAGDTLHIPRGSIHGVMTADSAVEALSVFSPAMDPKKPDVHIEEDR
ncbi:MAG: cupin domain-containing protein [Proteobacteria bacterium]|nr:cupin domain-containing protein [Pseudomonadota bacterium]